MRGLLTFRRDSGLSQCQEPASLYHKWEGGFKKKRERLGEVAEGKSKPVPPQEKAAQNLGEFQSQSEADDASCPGTAQKRGDHRLTWLRDLRESIGLPSLRVRASLEEVPKAGLGAGRSKC